MPQAPTSEPPNDLTRGDMEAIPLDQLAKLHHSHDIYQEHGPDLPELPPELPNYPLLRFQVIEQYHQQELQQPPQNDLHSSQPSSNQQFTSPGSIPLVPFEALFHKDHSGRTILHHLVESTELSPSRLGLLACAAVDPFEQRNFSTLYAAMSNQAIPFLSPLPPSLSSDVFSGSQKPSNVALLDGNHKSTIVGHDDNEEDEDDEDNLVEIEEVGGGQEVNNNMSSSEHSVATVLNAMTTVQFNTPNLPLLFTLGNAIKSPLHSAVDSGNNNSSVFLSSHGDEELLTFLDTLNATTTESITKLVQQQQQQQQSQPPPNNHPVRSIITQRKHLIYNPPSSLLPQTHDPVIRSHHLGLLHRTIFSTDQPLLFWLSYINYYCQMTNLPQAPVYLASIQTPRTRQHHLSYRKAVMLRQLRHRFPLTIDPTSPEELQNLMRHFHQSNHKRKQQQRRLGEREQDRRTPRYSGHVPYSKPHPSKSGYGGKLHLDNIPSSDSSSDDDEDDETSDDDDDEDDDDDDDDRDGDDNGDNKASKSHQSKKKSYNNKRGDHHRKNSKAQKTHNRYQSKHQQPQKSTYQEREAKRQLKLANKQRRAVVGFSATVIGLAVATIGYFWLTTYAHGDDEQIEPTGEITTYQYTKDHDRLVREQKSKRRR